jgi:type VI secretion system (T6SS) effector TldE1-like protein
MKYLAATADKPSSGRSISFYGKIALVIAAIPVASGAAVWISDIDPIPWVSSSFSQRPIDTTPFEARFSPGSASNSLSMSFSPHSCIEALLPELEIKYQQAKSRTRSKLQSQDWRIALMEESTPSSVAAVPLPKSRPFEADLELRGGGSITDQADNRTLLQKLSDLFPARVTLASLAPDGGLLGGGRDLASLGYDNLTAVYDISAHAVYMPNGSKLEAHSGFGSLMDNPGHVSERNVGATPPNVYDLEPRERLFHGVPALRMIPVGDNGTLGRSGLLARGYMLGPNGDSNGSVSIKNYEKFLSAFKNGEIKRLVVVPSLSDGWSASRRSVSQS